MPPESIIVEPSATIFNATMIATGLLVIAGSLLLFGAAWMRGRGLAVLVSLFGFGVLGVGLFPGDDPVAHPIFAMLAFVAGGLSAVAAAGATAPPFRYISAALGLVALLDLGLYFAMGPSSPFAALGIGGLERWVAYPIVLWTVGFGGHLMGSSAGSES